MNEFLNHKKIYLFSLLAFIVCSVFSIGFYHPDEHFQVLEFASSKYNSGIVHNLPWEFSEKIRPTIQPAIVVFLHFIANLFGEVNPFHLAFTLRLLSFLLCFASIHQMFRYYSQTLKEEKKLHWFAILTFLSWFVIFNGVRFSSENWSGSLFLIAFTSYFKIKDKKFIHFFLVGILIGLSILFRYQLLFMMMGFFAWIWFQGKENIKNILVLSLGTLVILLLGILIDAWFYGTWTLSIWNYFTMNILHDKASSFGTSPWYYYFSEFLVKGIPPFSIIILLSFIYFIRYQTKNVITWTIVPFILVHVLIAHKEIRFLFPIIGFLPIIIATSCFEIYERLLVRPKFQRFFYKTIRFSIVLNFIVLAVVCFRPMTTKIYLFRVLHQSTTKPTILYCLNAQPYLDIQFYKPKLLIVKEIQNLSEIQSRPKFQQLLLTNSKDAIPGFSTPLFTTYPNWIKAVNFGNWVEKSEVYNVYSIRENQTFSKRSINPL